jgi:hypothetical protein
MKNTLRPDRTADRRLIEEVKRRVAAQQNYKQGLFILLLRKAKEVQLIILVKAK